MSSVTDVHTAPFGGVSLAELRRKTAETRVTSLTVTLPSWEYPVLAPARSFEEVLDASAELPPVEIVERAPASRRLLAASCVAAVVLVPGTVIYLGLTWSSWNLLGVAELLPW